MTTMVLGAAVTDVFHRTTHQTDSLAFWRAFLQGRGRAASCCYHVGVRALWCVCVSLGHVHARASVRALCERVLALCEK